MKIKRILTVLLSAAMLAAVSVPALAADTAVSDPVVIAAPTAVSAYRLEAKAAVTALNLTAAHPYVLVKTEAGQALQLNLSDATAVLDTQTGLAVARSAIRVGESVYVYYSPAMTASLPAQSACEAIVVHLDANHAPAHLLTVESAENNVDGSVTVLTDNGGLQLTVSADAAVTPYLTKNIVTIADLRMGQRFFAWYDAVAASYPGQATAAKAVLLPPADNAKLIMLREGDIAIGEAKIENGVVLVPLRKAAEALGFTVTWNAQERDVHLTNGTVQTVVVPGEDSYYMATAIPGAVGMSAPEALGAAAYVVNGVTWAPAELLNLLLGSGTVTLRGTSLYL